MDSNRLDSNKMDVSDKVNHRTHHTRFFEKLYGNLDTPSDKKNESVGSYSHGVGEVNRQDILNSPSGSSSGSSSEIFVSEMNAARCK